MTRLALALLLAPAMAAAQDDPGIAFTFGAGVSSVPSYFGASGNEIGPDLAFDLDYLSVGPVRFGSRDPVTPTGLGFRGSFRYVPERDGSDLAGTGVVADDLDRSFEVGGGLRYALPSFEAFAVARYASAPDAVVGEVGADLIGQFTPRFTLRAGPRVTLGSDGYADYYFSTATTEASGGVISTGVEFTGDYRLTDNWGVEASVRYDQLKDDAADSPISEDDDQFSASFAVTRRFSFAF